ncbi:hypothetical protein [Spongorhabdus nitratireducens]
MKSKLISIVVLVLALVGLFAVVQQLSDKPLGNELLETVSVQCNVAESCKARLSDNSEVVFAVKPAMLRPLEPLSISVGTSLQGVQVASVRFTGTTMDMGLQPVELTLQSEGKFTGEGMITFCTTGSAMVWVAEVALQGSDGIRRVLFELGHPDLA